MHFLTVITLLLPLTSAFPITVHYPNRDVSIHTSIAKDAFESQHLLRDDDSVSELDRKILERRDPIFEKTLERGRNLMGLNDVKNAAAKNMAPVVENKPNQGFFQTTVNGVKNGWAKLTGGVKTLDEFGDKFVRRPEPGSPPILVHPREGPKNIAEKPSTNAPWYKPWAWGQKSTPPQPQQQPTSAEQAPSNAPWYKPWAWGQKPPTSPPQPVLPPVKPTWWQKFKLKWQNFKGKIWPFNKNKVTGVTKLNTDGKASSTGTDGKGPVTGTIAKVPPTTEKSPQIPPTVPEGDAKKPGIIESFFPERAGGLPQDKLDARRKAWEDRPIEERKPGIWEGRAPEILGGLPQTRINAMNDAVAKKTAASSVQTNDLKPPTNVQESPKVQVEQPKSPNVNVSPKVELPKSPLTGKTTDSSNTQVEQLKSPSSPKVEDLRSSAKLDSPTVTSTDQVTSDANRKLGWKETWLPEGWGGLPRAELERIQAAQAANQPPKETWGQMGSRWAEAWGATTG